MIVQRTPTIGIVRSSGNKPTSSRDSFGHDGVETLDGSLHPILCVMKNIET